MAPLPPNSTRRFWLDYDTGITPHSMMIRTAASTSDAQALSFFSQWLAALQPLLSDEFSVVRVRRSEIGTNISLPIPIGALSTFTGSDTDAPTEVDVPKEAVWVGRSLLEGRRWECSMYGLQFAFPGDYRFEGVEIPAPLQDAIDVLEEFVGLIVAIDGSEFAVYPYVNVNNNSYWESQQRKS